ncbi:protein FAM162A-like [Lytechinus variegatus]|uniref:protein FAM162A-like n=1 Tax=Lytechinus variegatus TaxID=7654 RepID=UPI001BB2B6BE|nr:protein FAM162A-like [Lytechinus variegatus]
MQACHIRRSSRAVMTLFQRGINMSSDQSLRKLSSLPMSKNSLGLTGSKQMAAGRQHGSDLSSRQTSKRLFCDKTNKDIEVDGKTSRTPEKVQQVASNQQHEHFNARVASGFDKRLLVYFGKYKNVGEVPELVSVHLLNSTRNKFRVYTNIFIGFLTMFGCGLMIYRGHRRAGTGETLADHNMRRHPQHYKLQENKD